MILAGDRTKPGYDFHGMNRMVPWRIIILKTGGSASTGSMRNALVRLGPREARKGSVDYSMISQTGIRLKPLFPNELCNKPRE